MITRVRCYVEFKDSKQELKKGPLVWMVRSIISFNNAILVFIDREKRWVQKVEKREVKELYHMGCGSVYSVISLS